MPDNFAADTASRCRWALNHNGGHPSGAWSTGERLAVALVLHDRETLKAMGYTPKEAAQRVYGGMIAPPAPADFPTWIDSIRAEIREA